MNRRGFLKVLGGLSAAIAVPVDAIAAVLPKAFAVSPIEWTKAYDVYHDRWVFRADCFIGKNVAETPTHISIENPIRCCVDVCSATEELDDKAKEAALLCLVNHAKGELRTLQNA